ncbi:AAA family ATPase [Nannocystaceae bacterium ST9]
MPFLNYLDPASVEPDDLVDREAPLAWLRQGLDSYLRAPKTAPGRAFSILGEKGVGKSLLTHKVVADLRQIHLATTLFLDVDCRRFRNQRAVYGEIARQAVDQLAPRADVHEPLLATARILETIAKYDDVERRVIHEHLVQHKAALQLKGPKALIGFLGASYDISMQRGRQSRETLEGSISFDPPRLREAVIDFFHDVRAGADFDILLVLDNVDELDHDAIRSEEARARCRGETDGLLGLTHAKIGLILTMRTYFAGILGREVDEPTVLTRLSPADHVALVRGRLTRESAEIQQEFAQAPCVRGIERLAELAPTPLALLKWLRYLSERNLHTTEDAATALRGLLTDRYAQIRESVIEAVVREFDISNAPVSRDRLVAACEGDEGKFAQLLRYQILLPVDFWYPYEFTLTPELHFLLAAREG